MAIFVSYSRRDEDAVKALAQGFETAKRQVWFDHDLGGGDAWWDSILANIRSSTVFLFALSDAAIHSKPCRLVLDYAIALDRPILPVQVGPVTSFRMSPLAEFQIIPYRPDDAQSGFAVLAAVDEVDERRRPLPDPLPPPPPIPFAYLLALGQQIDSTELSQADQIAVVDQLRRALDEETDESVRRDILSMLENLKSKPWRTMRIEREIAALLYAHAPRPEAQDEAPSAGHAPDGEQPTAAGPPRPSEADPRAWFEERIEALQSQREAREPERSDPPIWRPQADASTQWSRTFGPGPTAEPPTFAPPMAASYDPSPTSSYQSPYQPQPPPANPWNPPSPGPPPGSPPNYWAMSIVAFLLSFLFGGIAMYFSYQVGQRFGAGDVDGAKRASNNAKVWGIVGIVVGGLFLLILSTQS